MNRITYILLTLIYTVNVFSQEDIELSILDSTELQKRQWHSHSIAINAQRVYIVSNNSALTNHRLNWYSSLSQSIYLDIGLGLIDLINKKTNIYTASLRHQTEKGSIGMRFNMLADDIQGFQSISLNGYRYLSNTIIGNSDLSVVKVNGNVLLPYRIGLTKIVNRVSMSSSLSQNLTSLNDLNLLYKFSITYENKKSNVYSLYLVTGDVSQPLENPLLNSLNMNQLSYGVWGRVNLSRQISISIAAGQLRLTTDDITSRSDEINISITLKL